MGRVRCLHGRAEGQAWTAGTCFPPGVPWTGSWRAHRVSANSLEPHRTRILDRVLAASVEEGKEAAATPPRAVWFGLDLVYFPHLSAFPPSESLYPGA